MALTEESRSLILRTLETVENGDRLILRFDTHIVAICKLLTHYMRILPPDLSREVFRLHPIIDKLVKSSYQHVPQYMMNGTSNPRNNRHGASRRIVHPKK